MLGDFLSLNEFNYFWKWGIGLKYLHFLFTLFNILMIV